MDQNADLWKHCLEYAALSDLGLRRANNQDSLAVVIAGGQAAWQQRGHLFMVADGMGAHVAGELASKMAVDCVPLTYQKMLDASPPDALRHAISDANQQIHDRGQASDDFRGMGTTASSLVILPQGAVIGHVGDSRVYRLRGQRFEQITFDHSLVWEMSAAGHMPDNQVPEYVPRNIITRSLGPNAEVEVDLEGPFPLETGDTFLLCSDGLSGQVRDDEIGTILGCMPPEDAVRSLVDLANLRGGPDNITVIVARVTGPQVAKPNGQPNARPRPPIRPVHPLFWSLLALLALATVGSIALEAWEVAVASLVGTVFAGLAVLGRRHGWGRPRYEFGDQPLGKGPYRSFGCTPNGEFVERLAQIVQQLRDEAARNDWLVDWHHFNEIRAQADEAAFTSSHTKAVRLYCHAMSFMLAQLRARQ
ncbi:MAG: protein phosphatase 2C domain-containing protein [Planctomycetia bacterium]|nr:protein phosphatase 2C domain-containing protein [Planctomycetia bacterium]